MNIKKIAIIISVICVAVIIAAVVLGLAGGSGNSRVENTTAGTSQSTAATHISLPPAPEPPELPEATDESYFDFKYKIRRNAQTLLKEDEWYSVSAKSIDNLPEVLVIPDEYNGLEVRYVSDHGFGGAKIKKLFLGKNISVLNGFAFYGCTELEEVVFYGEGNITLGEYCFRDCTSLESVIFSDNCNLEKIEKSTFYGCESLKTLALPKTVSSIARDAFIGCNDVNIIMESNENIENRGNCLIQKSDKSLLWCRSADDIPTDGSVTHVENFYFLERDGVTEYVMPDAIESIGEGAFEKCKSLKSIVLSKNLKEIPDKAFNGLEKLANVTAYEISSIGLQAFDGCVKLTKIPFEGDIEKFNVAFNKCTGLTEVTFQNTVWIISSFNNCTNIKSIAFSEKTERIKRSFSRCEGVSELVIPEGVQVISSSFNYLTGLEKVTLPKSITLIEFSFMECIRLRDIYYGGTMEDWENADIDIVGQLTVHCTDGDIKLYIE